MPNRSPRPALVASGLLVAVVGGCSTATVSEPDVSRPVVAPRATARPPVPADRRYDATATQIDVAVGHTVELGLRLTSCSRPDAWSVVQADTNLDVWFVATEFDRPLDPNAAGGGGPATAVFGITGTAMGSGRATFRIERRCPRPEPDVPNAPDEVALTVTVTAG